MNHLNRPAQIGLLLFLASAQTLHAQMSVDDAEKLMRERRNGRAAATQPMSETDRLREENTRLREDNAALRQEVASLREALDHLMRYQAAATPAGGGPATAPTTRPTNEPPAQASPVASPGAGTGLDIAGHYRGGSADNGTAFLVNFRSDGTYEQNWFMPPRDEPGHYQINSDGTIEMWSDHAPASAPHHLWRISSDDNRLTLTPLLANGDRSADPPQVLTRTEK